ncbi:hypothetical protein LCGC14_0176090 [marine sediment metagenome]|uniref:Uncharacterized protein n=1 Tax=marine sediment metagenome TaxID=412755 RepID=A0A0F9URH0_9ZZZZ
MSVAKISATATSKAGTYAIIGFFYVAKYVALGVIIMGVMIAVESWLASDVDLSYFWNLYNVMMAMTAMVASLLKGIWYGLGSNDVEAAFNWTLTVASGKAMIGHLAVSILDVFFTALFGFLRIMTTLFGFFMDDSVVVVSNLGFRLPASCTPEGYPDWVWGDVVFVKWLSDGLNTVFDFKLSINQEVCVGDLVFDWFGTNTCATFAWESPTVGELVPDFYATVQSSLNTSFVPTFLFDWLTGVFQETLSFLFGDYSGRDIFGHHFTLGFQKLEHNADGSAITSVGSKPFETYISRKMAQGFGCPA